MLTVPPPVKPVVRLPPTNQCPRKMYTLHETMNNALALRAMQDSDKTAMIAFARETDALTMGTMLENHYRTYKEWPDLVINSSIKIFSGNGAKDDLKFLQAAVWSPEELTMICCTHYMDILQIDELFETKNGYNIKGARLLLEGTNDLYIAACNRMLRLSDDGLSTEMDW
jgi:hypothetical protein